MTTGYRRILVAIDLKLKQAQQDSNALKKIAGSAYRTRKRVQLSSMFRRCVSLLVLAGFLAGQLAAVPHAHGAVSAEEQREHDAAPHFHCASMGHARHHHDHSHSGHSHSHPPQPADEGRNPNSGESAEVLVPNRSGAGHDADAIYVPKQTWAISLTGGQDRAVAAWLVALAAVPSCTFAAEMRSSPRWHPPDKVLDASDLYLTLRNLRI